MEKRKRERSLSMLLYKAFLDLFGKEYVSKVRIEFSTGNGIYFKTDFAMDAPMLEKVYAYTRDLVDRDLRIEKNSMRIEDATALFASMQYADKVKLFRFKRSSWLNIHEVEGYKDYFYGSLAKRSSEVGNFALELYKEGFVLVLPENEEEAVPKFKPNDKVFEKLAEDARYLSNIGIENVSDLNAAMTRGGINELILMQEAFMEKKIGDIANRIIERKGVRFIMIAGPSSSGKTTFSKRLAIHLRANGLRPHTVEVDNYFKNRVDTPKNPDGSYDFESLGALDVEAFNADMLALIRGERVEMPHFNFITGEREYRGEYLQLSGEDVLVIEGIHCLNDAMSRDLDADLKFKIYISALTTLNIDEHNRIATTDVRLLRRMVRDARTRGASATRTIAMWKGVRKGEDTCIFPYQDSADVVFNSTLCYELPVLKIYAEPLLFSVDPDSAEYEVAKRLLKFLDYVLGLSGENIPHNSILKEFIGGSCFHA